MLTVAFPGDATVYTTLPSLLTSGISVTVRNLFRIIQMPMRIGPIDAACEIGVNIISICMPVTM